MTEKINFVKDNVDYATDMPVWQLVILNIITVGLYSCYWAYVNIRMLNYVKKSDISPWIGIFLGIPLVPYYIFYKILSLNYQNKLGNHVVTLILMFVSYYFLQFGYAEAPICIIVLLTFIPEAIIQYEINKYIKRNRL
jgi:hypothetical protein